MPDLKKYFLIFIIDLLLSFFWINYLGEVILFLVSTASGVILNFGINLLLLFLINNFLVKKIFRLKKVSLRRLEFLLLPIISMVLVIISPYSSNSTKNILEAEYLIYSANNISIGDLTETYDNSSLGFSFKYPNHTKINTDDNQNNIEISSFKNSWAECELSFNPPDEPGNNLPNTNLGNYEWKKWYFNDWTWLGNINKVTWFRKWGGNGIRITAYQEVEKYCEKIISTFNFY